MKIFPLFLMLAVQASAWQWPDYSNPNAFLIPGTQSALHPDTFATIKAQAGITDAEMGTLDMVGKVYAWMGEYFTNAADGGKSIGKNTVASLLSGRKLYGCTDWGLVSSAILRAGGMPSLMVDAVGVDWMANYQKSGGSTPDGFHGHVFTEVLVQGKWILAEHNTKNYYENYNPNDPIIPMQVGPEKMGFFVMRKGPDPASYGITSDKALNELMKVYAKTDLGPKKWPAYTAKKLPYN